MEHPSLPEKDEWAIQEKRLILNRFIRTLLPPLTRRHRNMANEVNYIATTMTRLMLQNFGFRVTREDVISTIRSSGYAFFTKEGPWNPTKNCIVRTQMSSLFPGFNTESEVHSPSGNGADYVYVNMDGQDVRMLRSLTLPAPSNISKEKMAQREEMALRLEHFKQNVHSLITP